MNTFLRVAALFVAVLTIALWFFGGFNFGSTRWIVPVEHPSDHGQTIVVHESRFLPGSDFLAAGLAVSAGLLLSGCLRGPARLNRIGPLNDPRS